MKNITLVDQYGRPTFHEPEAPLATKKIRAKSLVTNAYNPDTYEFDETFQHNNNHQHTPSLVRTTVEMLHCLAQNPAIELDARVLGVKEDRLTQKILGRSEFVEAFTRDKLDQIKFKESDFFAVDNTLSMSVGNDFTPLLGGPFYKNLYYYQDYIKMHAEAFYAYHHDPVAHAVVQITRDFVLGTGFEVQCDTKDKKGQLAMALWRSFEKVNNYHEQVDQCCTELSIYGENMWWWLPNHQTKIVYQLAPGDTIPEGLIPRIRLIDPSNIVEIVTYPEDISRPLFYVWLTPTQYQMFTSGVGNNQTSQQTQPTLKFIYQQIPAEQMMHNKINGVSNEKRGRSDLFPVFSYLKRLRDSVNFNLIALQKAAAWAIDTEIDGDQTDVDAYAAAQAALGTIPPAGSEFVHSKAITRTILASQGSGGVNSDAFSWCLSMIAIGTGIPVSYFGTHLSGGQTKASALVGTEPVAKKMEKRREVLKRMVKATWDRLMTESGLGSVECDIIFPEIITQDRAQKIKDIIVGQSSRFLNTETAATLYAKELGIQGYDYKKELEGMDQVPSLPMPLSDPGKEQGPAGLTSQDKKDAKDADRNT